MPAAPGSGWRRNTHRLEWRAALARLLSTVATRRAVRFLLQLVAMQTQGINRIARLAAGGLYGIGLLSNSIAGTIPGRTAPVSSSLNSATVAKALQIPSTLNLPTPLDLRAPHELFAPSMHVGPGAFGLNGFSGLQRPSHGLVDSSTDDRGARLGLRIDTANFRVATPVEKFVARVRKEGLPIARLWQSESALVSIGLNQRGKPGVWFTKRIH